jgi:hypothetical protein
MFEPPQTDSSHPQRLGLEASSVRPPHSARTQTARAIHRSVEPLVQRLFRKVRTSDSCFSAMVFAFKQLQRLGLSVGPNHFYWPVPDLSELERQRWPANTLTSWLDLRLSSQLQWLHQMAAEYSQEWTFPDQPTASPRYHYNNGFFETVDAEMAYCFVRHFKPSRIIEVGGGFSTRLLTEALRANLEQDGTKGELTTIDPGLDPSTHPFLAGSTQFIQRPVQEVDLKLFLSLKEGDILFLDSSHVVGVGSDVVYEYLEVVPRLRPGVLVHAHDIFVPFDYPRELVVGNLSFWSEQYLLRAFLSFNPCFEVLWGSSGMQAFHSDVLEKMFPRWKGSYRNLPKATRRFVPSPDGERVWPSSFWMRRMS